MLKRLLITFVGVIIITIGAIAPLPVLAQDEAQPAQTGTLQSDNAEKSHLQFIKYWYRDAKIMFKSDAAEKARFAISYAEEEIETIEELCKDGRYEYAFAHCDRYQKYLQQVIESLQEASADAEEDLDQLLAQLEELQLQFESLMAQILEEYPDIEDEVMHALEHSHQHMEQFLLNTMGNKELLKYQEMAMLRSDNVSDRVKMKMWRITNRNMTMLKYQEKNSAQSDNVSSKVKIKIKERIRVHSDNSTEPQQYCIKEWTKSRQENGVESAPGQQKKIAYPFSVKNNDYDNDAVGKGNNDNTK